LICKGYAQGFQTQKNRFFIKKRALIFFPGMNVEKAYSLEGNWLTFGNDGFLTNWRGAGVQIREFCEPGRENRRKIGCLEDF